MPNRIIKESICRSDSVNELTYFEEILFYRLITACDDYGRFDGRPAIIKGTCFPLRPVTEKDIEKALDKLSAVGVVSLYKVYGKPHLQFVTWEKHQSIRAKKSKYPGPNERDRTTDESNLQADEINCIQMQANVPVIQSNPNPNNTCAPEEHERTLRDSFEIIYGIYPKKKGKERAFGYYSGYRSNTGRSVNGKRWQLTDRQIYIAVKKYVDECERDNIELQYYKQFDTLLSKDIIGYLEVKE